MSYSPDWVSPPGETLAEILEERGITRSQFGEMLGWNLEDVERVIKGEKMIDGEIALAFESVLGISSIFWLNREKKLSRLLKGLICIEALFRKESPGFKENWGIFAVGRDSVKAG